jgi:peptide/nickel transport system permease protein
VRYALQKIGQFAIVFFIVTFTVMILMRLGLNAPGDPARTLLGGTVDQAKIDAATEEYKLDSNEFVQYVYWLGNMAQGDMGFSEPTQKPVSELIQGRIMTTLLLGFYAIVWGLIIAVPLAVRQAHKRDSWFDKFGSGAAFAFVSAPAIVLAPILTILLIKENTIGMPPPFGDYQVTIGGWFPRIGDKVYPWQDLGEHFKNFFVPTLVLTLPIAAIFSRLLRGDMVMTLQADFVTLASAKGVSPRRVLWVHALRNSLFSLLTNVGLQIGGIVGGAIVAEQFFDLDGMGALLVTAILTKDLFIVQSASAILVGSVVLVNLTVDLMYGVLDPRIRNARALA